MRVKGCMKVLYFIFVIPGVLSNSFLHIVVTHTVQKREVEPNKEHLNLSTSRRDE